MSYYQRQRDRWESEEREFTLTVEVTKVYEIETTVMATSEDSAQAQYDDLKAELAGSVTDDEHLEGLEVELVGCSDPIPDND